ncbi:MAG TPA: methyltransferase domain-containing protein [Phototrophicaceae bacterium]|nr:methyltransferase domain-containing protein [Phototrophicaceae bacterium]
MTAPTVNFGNWIRLRIVFGFLLAGFILIGLSVVIPISLIRLILWLVAGITLAMFTYLIYVYYQFSDQGGGLQRRLWTLVIDHLSWEHRGQVLDIGTGNGPLSILLAAKYSDAQVTGIDYWGQAWEYSQQVCEQNAAIMGVAERTHFQKASASNLPFEEGTFDAAISHFVFHEVADAPDKRAVIREALRVIRKGGAFAFQDMFLDQELYGDMDTLLATIRSWGIEEVHFVDTGTILNLPRLLRTPRVLGNAALIYGRK